MEATDTPSDTPVMTLAFNAKESSLLRASRVTLVLGGCGGIFANSEGSAETYALSEPVTRMDTFLSHNWSTPRYLKFAILAMHYNFVPALICAGLAMGTIFALTAFGLLPLLEVKRVPEEPVEKTGVCATLVGPLIFLFALFSWHEVAGRVGLMNAKLFLDKTCIHQVDPDKKRRGILSLAAFLERTDGMLVVYTSTYLRRLWTVFELASLLILYPEKELRVMPTYFSRPVVLGLLFAHVGSILFMVLGMSYGVVGHVGPLPITPYLLRAFLGGVFIDITAHLHIFENHNIWAAARSFNVANAACAVESDRELVTGSVEKFLKARGLVPEGTARGKALQSFNQMVHRDVPAKLLQSHGPLGMPYKYIAVVFLPMWCRSADWLGALVHEGGKLGEVAFLVVLHLLTAVLFLPLQSALASALADSGPSVERWQGRVLRAGSLLTTCTIAVINHFFITFLTQRYEHHRASALGGLAFYIVILTVLLCSIHLGMRKRYRNHLRVEDKDELQLLTSE